LSGLIQEKDTIRVVLGLIFPGAGHIYLGNKKQMIRGIKIAIAFVIVSYLQNTVFNFIPFEFAFIPLVAIWIWQIFDLIKITEKRSANNSRDTIDTINIK
jgi:hypothetical protein